MKTLTLRSILLSATLALTSITAMAQEEIPVIHVNVPYATRFVKINTEGVNLRRLPNTTSGKVMMWNSDGGSVDTYTKLFYGDTEASRYRPSRSTGAYVAPYHPQKDDLLMVNPDQNQPKNGWYQVLAFSEIYAGNLGKANSRFGWVKGDFCKVVDVASSMPEQLLSLKLPYTFSNPNNPEEEKVDYLSLQGNLLKRSRGRFNNFEYMVAVYYYNSAKIIYPQIEGDFMILSEANVSIEYNPHQAAPLLVEKVIEEGMDEDYETFKFLVRGNKGKEGLHTFLNSLRDLSDKDMELIVNQIAPEGQLPTDRIVFRGTDGNAYSFSYTGYVLPRNMCSPSTIPLQTAQ